MMMMRTALAVLSLWLVVPQLALAQARVTGADLEGIVVDQSGGVLPGVALTVTNEATNLSRSIATDAAGHYYVPALPVGVYRVSAAMSGFIKSNREGVVLSLGQSVVVDFTLHVAGTSEVVTVTRDAGVVPLNRTEISTVVNHQQIDTLPINGRNFISFSALAPGVTTDRTPQQGASATSGLSFTGQRARSNNVMVDGLDNNDQVVGAVRATFSQEAVSEFQVLTNSYSAEFGRASGGVVNIVTKSGTNELRGNVFYYFRDDALNAKNYFDRFDVFGRAIALDKAPFNQKQWGATAGGPVRRDRTFYFLSAERSDAVATNLVTIQPDAAALLNSMGFPVELGNVAYANTSTAVLGKIDHQWANNHSMVVRGSFADVDNENIEPFGGSVARSRGAEQLRTDWSLSASETDLVGARAVNEFRVQYAPQNQEINSLDPRCGGHCLGENQGGPTLEITGVASAGRQRFTPQPRDNARLQVLDTISAFRAGHRMKGGIEFNSIRSSKGSLPLHFGGRYIFSAVPALGIATSLDALRLGLPAAYVQGYGNSSYAYTTRDMSLFAQDEWRIGRAVVKPGLRYQRQFWPEAGYDVSDIGGARFAYQLPADSNNIAPRLAVAYDLTGDGKTLVHGSYGLFYDATLASVLNVTQILNGSSGVRTLVVTLGQRCGSVPCSVAAWNSPGRQLSEDAAKTLLGGSYPTLTFSADPALRDPFAHQAAVGFDRQLANDLIVSTNFLFVRGFNQIGTLDYNPVVPSLGAGRRPNDLPCGVIPSAACVNSGIPGTSASVLQYTSFGETWYKGLTVSATKRLARQVQFMASYTLSKAEDNSTDFQSNFIPQSNGRGRNPADKYGLPLGFDPDSERGPATHDQRHRFVVSGFYRLPGDLGVSAIFTGASGRPFTPLAGLDLNGDGNGGAFPPDRARTNPLDESTSVGRNSATTAGQVNLDLRASKLFRLGGRSGFEAIVDVFNVFNRANFFEDTNQSSFAIFGNGAFPSNPLPTYGKYVMTLPPRQVQLAGKITF